VAEVLFLILKFFKNVQKGVKFFLIFFFFLLKDTGGTNPDFKAGYRYGFPNPIESEFKPDQQP
jgi:hypothetical protein